MAKKSGQTACIKTAAVSIIALTVALSAAEAGQKTTISGDVTSFPVIYGNHAPGNYGTVSGSPQDNAVTFTKGAKFSDTSKKFFVNGGYTTGETEVKNNAVTIDDLSVNAQAFGIIGGNAAKSDNAKLVSGNTVTVNNGEFNAQNNGESDELAVIAIGVAGGLGGGTGNVVTVNGGKFNSDSITIVAYEGGDADGNAVTVNGGEFDAKAIMISVGGQNERVGDIRNNTVTVAGGTFAGQATMIVGGMSSTGGVSGNKVYVSGGTFDNEFTLIYGGMSSTGRVSGNKVYVSGGTFDGEEMTVISGGLSGTGEISDNKVYVSGGTFNNGTNLIVAGMTGDSGTVKNNTVYVYGDVDLSKVDLVAAAKTGYFEPVASGGGNTLMFGYKGVPWASAKNMINGITGFDTVQIGTAAWGKPIVVASINTDYAEHGVTKIVADKVAFPDGYNPGKGEKTVLLKAGAVDGEVEAAGKKSTYTVGTTLEGTASVDVVRKDGTTSEEEPQLSVTYTIDSVYGKASAQTHTAPMGMSAGIAAVNQGADTVLAALRNLGNSRHNGLEAFSAVGGGTSRQETGSHVTLNAFDLAAGLGSNIDADAGLFTVGGALEAGYGSFKNHFDAGDADPFVKKSGHLYYYGAAVAAGMKWNSLWHADGTFRAGYAKSEQSGSLYNPGTGTVYDVDIGAYYVGTEIGGGKAFKLDDTNAVDVYARYFWLHRGDDDFYAGGFYDLKSVDSHRLRTGARYDLSLGNKWGFYAGLAYEYEFDGESRLFVDGVEAEAVKTKGGRAFGELGVKLTPEKDAGGLSLDLNVKGSAGSKMRAVLFGADVKYEF